MTSVDIETDKEDDEVEKKTIFVVVIGMNRVRLQKIMQIVENDEEDFGNFRKEQELVNNVKIKFVPCVATMGQYQDEDTGNIIKYLMNVSPIIHYDKPTTNPSASKSKPTMQEYFDDEMFRLNLSNEILLVGYEWDDNVIDELSAGNFADDDDKTKTQTQQQEQLKSFFVTAGFEDANINCIKPNPEFQSLSDEIEHMKQLSEEEKKIQLSVTKTLGPAKMARFISDETIGNVSATLNDGHNKSRSQQEVATFRDGNGEINNDEIPCQQADVNDPAEEEQPATSTTESCYKPAPSVPPRLPPSKMPPVTINLNQPRYACRMCRTIIFGEDHLADNHIQSLHSFNHNGSHKKTTLASCQSMFCDEIVLEWLNSLPYIDVEGKLECPKCHYKLGHYNWSGSQCSCGTWVTPAIQIPVSKVDKIW